MIRLEHVTVRHPRAARPALDDVSLEFQAGEFAFVTGPSGAGKSTLLRLLYVAERPESGEVSIEDRSLVRLHPRSVPFLRRNLGIIFQDFKLLPRRTVAANVALALEVCGQPRAVVRHKVERILRRVGLDGFEDRLPGSLSAGEQQRAAIARALVNEPSVVLADEPTGNLDEALSGEIVDLLAELARERRTTVLVATHDTVQVGSRGFRIVRLRDGKVERDEPATQPQGTEQPAEQQAAPPEGRVEPPTAPRVVREESGAAVPPEVGAAATVGPIVVVADIADDEPVTIRRSRPKGKRAGRKEAPPC